MKLTKLQTKVLEYVEANGSIEYVSPVKGKMFAGANTFYSLVEKGLLVSTGTKETGEIVGGCYQSVRTYVLGEVAQ
jgi:hypothetical protein